MNKASLLIFLALLVIPISREANFSVAEDKAPKPKLRLEGHPRQGFAPMNVGLHAVLEGVAADDPRFYCLKEEWDFGDETKSIEEPHCDPYSPGTPIKSEFTVEHEYGEQGSFGVRLILGDKIITSNKISFKVMEKSFP